MCSVDSKETDAELDILSNMLISTYIVKPFLRDSNKFMAWERRQLETQVAAHTAAPTRMLGRGMRLQKA
jgi:hypothetical protein